MEAGVPSTVSAILCRHVTTVAEKGQKLLKRHFGFLYHSAIGIKPTKEDSPQ